MEGKRNKLSLHLPHNNEELQVQEDFDYKEFTEVVESPESPTTRNFYSTHPKDNSTTFEDKSSWSSYDKYLPEKSQEDYQSRYEKFVNRRRFSVPPFILHVLKKLRGKTLSNQTAEGIFLIKMCAALQKQGHASCEEVVQLNDFLAQVAHGIHAELGRKQYNRANRRDKNDPEDTKQYFGFTPRSNVQTLKVSVTRSLFDEAIVPSFNVARFEMENTGLRTRLFTMSERKVKKLFGSFNIPDMKRCLTRIDFFGEKELALFPPERCGKNSQQSSLETKMSVEVEDIADPYNLSPEEIMEFSPFLNIESKQSLAFTMASIHKTGKVCGFLQDPHFVPHTKIADDIAMERWKLRHYSVRSFVSVVIDEDRPFEVFFKWPERNMPRGSLIQMEFVWRFNGYYRDVETGMIQPVFRKMQGEKYHYAL